MIFGNKSNVFSDEAETFWVVLDSIAYGLMVFGPIVLLAFLCGAK